MDQNTRNTLLNDDNFVLVDVRTEGELAYANIEKAINIPLGEILKRYTELDKNKTIVFFCQSGERAEMASSFLTSLGYKTLNAGSYRNLL